MKVFIKLLLIAGVAVSCQGSSVLSRLSLSRSRRDLTGNECESEPHGALIPYPGDCTKFLQCEWNSGTVKNCPSGLHFNPVICVCDWPTSAGCTQGSPSSTTTPWPTTTNPSTISTTTPATPPTITPTTPPPNTSSELPTPTLGADDEVCMGVANGTLSPYPYDCAWYIRCEGDQPLVLPCQDGWLFNAILLICDYPENVDCTASPYPTTPSPTTVPVTTPSTLPTPEVTSTMSTDSPTPTMGANDEVCMGVSNGTLSPYPYDCAWYIRCESDQPLVLPCQDGWLFNAILLICDYPENVDCTASPYPTTPSPTTIPVTTPSTLPTPEVTSTMSTDSPTPTMGADDEVCMGVANGTLSPYPYDCAWYIRCESDQPLVLPCQDGWLFNAILLICDYPENVDCTASPYPTTNSPTTVPVTTPSTLPTPEVTSTMSTDSPTPTMGADDEVCMGVANGTLSPYPYDCAWYIRCESDQPLVLPCQDGWLFNAILLICDYPENVDCTASPYPTTPSPTTVPVTTPSTLPTPEVTSTMSTDSPTPTMGANDEVCMGVSNGTLSPYPYDCAWYIRCESDQPLVLPCQDGWLFNAILLICDYPENVDCTASPYPTTPSPTTVPVTTPSTLPTPEVTSTMSTDSPTPTMGADDEVCMGVANGTLSPYPYDCAWYIRCESDQPLVLPCQDGWLFNAILLICDYPENVDCTASPYPTTPAPTTVPVTSPSTLPTPPTPTVDPGTTTSDIPTPPTFSPSGPTTVVTANPTLPSSDDGICLNEVNGAVLPYPWDCAWYVRCENQIPEVLPCDDGLVYNSILRICDFPANVECVTTPYPTTDSTPTLGTNTTPDWGSTNTTPDWNSTTTGLSTEQPSTRPPYVGTGICANQELGTLLPYPGRCSLYIVCEETAPVAYNCSEGLEFNAELKVCQVPEIAGCSITTTTSTTTPASTTTEATTTPAPGVPTGICEGKPIGDLIPYPGICSEYIRCQLPIPIAQECPDDLEFNGDLQLCEAAEDAGCSISNVTTTIAPETTPAPTPQPGLTGICRGQQEGDLIPYPGDCNKYIICQNPIPIAQKCGAGLDFNAELGICDDPDEGGCSSGGNNSTTEATPTTPPPGTPGMMGICKGYQEGDLIPYPNKCNKYIRCENPVPIAQTCLAGLHFNEALGICDTTESAGCAGSSTTESPSGSTTPGPTTTPKPPAMTGLCSDQEIGDKIPYPENCGKYIVCDIPVPIAIACANGLHFNAELQVCDEPSAAGCEASGTSNVCCGQPLGTLLPYPNDCTQYIECAYPIPKALPCDYGLHFNATTKQCESVASAGCVWYSTTEATTTTTSKAPLTCATAPNGTLLPVEGNCNKYNKCQNGNSITLPCPKNTVFSPEAGQCVAGTVCPA